LITPADDFDDGPDLDPDDPLAVILRPASGHLGPPPGRYEEIRRGASRRRLLRAAAGVGATCAVAALAVLLPLRLTASDAPAGPAVPLAPPPATSPSTVPVATPAPTAVPGAERPTEGAATPVPEPRASSAPTGTVAPTPGHTPSRSSAPSEPGTPSFAPSPSSTRR
jgi:hypothetical protein